MKKIVSAFLFYTLFAAAVIFSFGFFSFQADQVPQTSELFFKISNGLTVLFDIIPSICFTGFLLGCSIAFGDSAAKAEHRFSSELSSILKKLLFLAIIITLVVSLCTLVFLPFQKVKLQSMNNIPLVLNEYETLSTKYLGNNSPELALKYIERALALDPKNERFNNLKKNAEIAKEDLESQELKERSISYAQTNLNAQKKLPDLFDESKMSVKEMLEKAQKHFEDHNFFGAHYFSTNARRLCKENEEYYKDIDQLVNDSWTELQNVQQEDATEGMIFFRKKLAAYKDLIDGNFVEAYHAFYALSQEDARKERDPDVMRYLDLSQKRVLENYFFTDETEDLSTFESVNNIYFSIPKPQGGYDIVLIRGITEIEGTGGMVRYLRGLQIWSFDASKNLLQTVKTPYAKMAAIRVSELNDSERRVYVTDNSTKMIPLIKLCSLSRFSNKEMNLPVYEFAQNPNPTEADKPNKFYWPIPYQDFTMIEENFSKEGSLNPFAVRKLSRKAPEYGYPREEFSFATMNKIFYPFMVLSFLIFIAIIAWNYRLGAHKIFKFKWIFILPLFNLLFYFVRRSVEYIVKILNFVFIAAAGVDLAYLAGIVFYILLLGAMILTFLARKGD